MHEEGDGRVVRNGIKGRDLSLDPPSLKMSMATGILEFGYTRHT